MFQYKICELQRNRIDNRVYKQLKDELIIENMRESWLNYVEPSMNANSLEGCLFMMNFNKNGTILATSSGILPNF